MSMRLTLECPACGSKLPLDAADAPHQIACGRCGRTSVLNVSNAVRDDAEVDQCPLCSGGDFYIRKDFDPKVGLSVVVVGGLISAGFYWFRMDLIAYSILALAVAVDLVVYGRLGDVTVCYRCHSEFRGKFRRTAEVFDLHTADVLEQEYERKIGRR